MCRFKAFPALLIISSATVSIHPMCRFKAVEDENGVLATSFQYILCVGSRIANAIGRVTDKMFQYILCVGSSYYEADDKSKKACFNTSYVSVQGNPILVNVDFGKFQYILCVGSS